MPAKRRRNAPNSGLAFVNPPDSDTATNEPPAFPQAGDCWLPARSDTVRPAESAALPLTTTPGGPDSATPAPATLKTYTPEVATLKNWVRRD